MKHVGVDRPIHDAKGKAAGFVKYAADVMLPCMAYAALVHSDVPHGRVIRVDDAAARALPGVLGVYHCLNTDTRRYNRYRSNYAQDALADEEALFAREARFVGDRVAAVVAVDEETAARAARLVKVAYEPLPHTVGFDDTLALADGVRDEFETELGAAPEADDGMIAVESELEFPRLHHATMETHACVADFDPYTRRLTVYSPNQAVHGIRIALSALLGLPQSSVRVVKATMGGSFGAKQEWFTEPVTAFLAMQLGKPVKLVYSRAESMTSAIVRGAMRGRVRSLFRPDGTLVSLSLDVTLDAGAYLGNGGDYVRALAGKPLRAYRLPHYRYHARVICSNTPVSGAYRGWSAPESALFLEHHMDAAANALGIDRIELRMKNALRSDEADAKSGVPLEEIRLIEALRLGRERFDWERRLRDCRAFNAAGGRLRRGVGVGCGGHGNTYFPRFQDYGDVRLQLNTDGSVQGSATLHDHGCGTVTAMRMIAAEVLGLPEEHIRFNEGDTDESPIDFGCFASRTTYVLGRTVYDAACLLRDRILDAAAAYRGLSREALYLDDGRVKCRAPAEADVPLSEMAKEYMRRERKNLNAEAQFANETNPGVSGAHFAYVEVDTWTGFVKILDYLAVQDIGQPINPGMCVAQIQGAAQMGCGAALREKMTVSPDGRCTESLAKYHLFLAPDLPNIRVELLTDGKSQDGPFGAKSIGEVCYVPAAPAVCGAVNHALGASLSALPYDPDCILKHLAKEREV